MQNGTKCRKKFKARVYRDAWSIDSAFKVWLLPRLKCLREYNFGYPEDRGSLENWNKELDENILYLEYMVKIESRESNKVEKFTDLFWDNDDIMKHCSIVSCGYKTIEELKDMVQESDADHKYLKQMYVQDALHCIFGEWFGKSYGNLWW